MKLLVPRKPAELPAGSMADIAFLMLTFYMVTTVFNDDKGLTIMLPPLQTIAPQPIHDRNLFTIHINSGDQFLIEGLRRDNIIGLKEELKTFIMNNGKNSKLSDNPAKAVISLKADRGASYKVYVATLDEIQAAYYDLYATQAGVTSVQFRKLDVRYPADRKLYDKGRKGIPMNISISD